MPSYNRVIVAGHLAAKPDLRYTPSGVAVCHFTVGINDRKNTPEGWKQETIFIDVTMFNNQAEVCNKYLDKGSPVLIEGKLKQDKWESDGQRRTKISIVGDKMQMLGGNAGQDENAGKTQGRNDERPQFRCNDEYGNSSVPF